MPPLSSRMTKNRPQPIRYRPGKAEVQDEVSEDEESESSEDEAAREEVAPRAPQPKATSFPSKKLAVDLSKADQQTSAAPKPVPKKQDDDLEGFVTASESSEEEAGGSSDEKGGESSEEEEESSDDEPKKPMLRPTFISKAKRAQQAQPQRSTEDEAAEMERKRKEKADEMLQAQLERDAANRAAGRKAWDDDADINPEDQVDDTDGIDPEAERAAWKLRELKRVRRDRLAIEEKEKEREEIERRRNMTAEEREAEDKVYIDAQNEEREGKGQMGFMQKYHHKGAFFVGDDEQDEEVKKVMNRDLAGARYVDESGDKGVLPEYMRIRDMTKLGKKGRTKYKDLKAEDTGRWGTDLGKKRRDYDGLDDRFRPDERGGGEREQTGANAQPVGERRRREDDGYRDRDDKRARYD
ncbi:hypothetical protein LTR85_008793 [Meristemomyces frigidus]|nr:hypothetical protein LTR85_008793 [Meristemomyces frigidus]